MKIHLLEYNDIDFEAYNRCVEFSPFTVMYAMSWYLDAVSPRWKLLMAEDYKYVMPLPVKQKRGLKYFMQPLFCQQLGIFSSYPFTIDIYKKFLSAIPYCICKLQFNPGNLFDSSLPLRNNYRLDLNNSYSHIQKNYKKNFIRNIKKAEKENFLLEESTDWLVFLDFAKKNIEKSSIRQLLIDFEAFIVQIKNQVTIKIWNIKNERAAILSAALFIQWKNRIYYMLPVSTSEGKQKQSMAFLLNKFIETHANKELILDFEGSSLPGVARFYAGTGAVCECFPVFSEPKILFDLVSFVKKLKQK
jgi:hypothetical protein